MAQVVQALAVFCTGCLLLPVFVACARDLRSRYTSSACVAAGCVMAVKTDIVSGDRHSGSVLNLHMVYATKDSQRSAVHNIALPAGSCGWSLAYCQELHIKLVGSPIVGGGKSRA